MYCYLLYYLFNEKDIDLKISRTPWTLPNETETWWLAVSTACRSVYWFSLSGEQNCHGVVRFSVS